MSDIRFELDTRGMEAWLKHCDAAVSKAAAAALTRTAVAVRADITRKLPGIFSSVTPATRRSILYTPAKAEDGLAKMRATVFIRDEGKDSSIPPEKWLRAEIEGGARRDKRSERVLKAAGIMQAGQQWTRGGTQGQITGPRMVQILSQLRAFGEQGFNANATAATVKRLKRKGVAVSRKTGMQFFVARDRRSREPLAVYQVLGRGKVVPVLWFVDRRPTYRVRFHFAELVRESAGPTFAREMQRALAEATRVGRSSSRA